MLGSPFTVYSFSPVDKLTTSKLPVFSVINARLLGKSAMPHGLLSLFDHNVSFYSLQYVHFGRK